VDTSWFTVTPVLLPLIIHPKMDGINTREDIRVGCVLCVLNKLPLMIATDVYFIGKSGEESLGSAKGSLPVQISAVTS